MTGNFVRFKQMLSLSQPTNGVLLTQFWREGFTLHFLNIPLKGCVSINNNFSLEKHLFLCQIKTNPKLGKNVKRVTSRARTVKKSPKLQNKSQKNIWRHIYKSRNWPPYRRHFARLRCDKSFKMSLGLQGFESVHQINGKKSKVEGERL